MLDCFCISDLLSSSFPFLSSRPASPPLAATHRLTLYLSNVGLALQCGRGLEWRWSCFSFRPPSKRCRERETSQSTELLFCSYKQTCLVAFIPLFVFIPSGCKTYPATFPHTPPFSSFKILHLFKIRYLLHIIMLPVSVCRFAESTVFQCVEFKIFLFALSWCNAS